MWRLCYLKCRPGGGLSVVLPAQAGLCCLGVFVARARPARMRPSRPPSVRLGRLFDDSARTVATLHAPHGSLLQEPSTAVIQSPCESVTRSVSLLLLAVCPSSLRPPSARAQRPGCSWPFLPPKGYLQSRQRSS